MCDMRYRNIGIRISGHCNIKISKDRTQSILQREGIRQLPGIYYADLCISYPVKCIGDPMKQGGTADRLFIRP